MTVWDENGWKWTPSRNARHHRTVILITTEIYLLYQKFWWTWIPSISHSILARLVHPVPPEDPDPWFGHCSLPVFSPSLAHRPRTQCRLTQDLIWTFWFDLVWYHCNALLHFDVLIKILLRLFSPKARVLFTCITIEISLAPTAILNLVQHMRTLSLLNLESRGSPIQIHVPSIWALPILSILPPPHVLTVHEGHKASGQALTKANAQIHSFLRNQRGYPYEPHRPTKSHFFYPLVGVVLGIWKG